MYRISQHFLLEGLAHLFFFLIFPQKSLNPWYLYSFQIIANRYSVFTDSWWVTGFSLSSRLHQESWLTTLYSLHLAEKVCFCLSISSSVAYPPSTYASCVSRPRLLVHLPGQKGQCPENLETFECLPASLHPWGVSFCPGLSFLHRIKGSHYQRGS